jgi:hypothetical protein
MGIRAMQAIDDGRTFEFGEEHVNTFVWLLVACQEETNEIKRNTREKLYMLDSGRLILEGYPSGPGRSRAR